MEIYMETANRSISLRLFADSSLIPLVQGAIEQAASVFGMSHQRVLKLVMAGEEIISYLAQTAHGGEVQITITHGGWCVIVDFSFEAAPSDLWIINLAAQKKANSGQEVEHLGLLLASRMMDRFTVRLKGRKVHLELRLDYEYLVLQPKLVRPKMLRGPLTIVDNPEPALIKEACAAVVNQYPPYLVHTAFFTPGKTVDMVAGGYLDMIVAVDEQGQLAGMLSWRAPSQNSISFSGPYIFAEGDDVARKLEMHLLKRVGRGNAESLFSDLATAQLVSENFESLGQIEFLQEDEQSIQMAVWFRLLRDDAGGAVWAHHDIVEFLEQKYSDLCLMRTIRQVDAAGEALPERSVFSTRLRPELKEATFVPMVVGVDVSESIARQVAALREDDYRNIFFHIDLASGWQAAMGGALLENGFVPRILLPKGGKSDVVVFQYA